MSSVKTGRKAKRDKKTIDSWKTKQWYEVYAPKSFKEVFIGNIPSSSPDSIPGRVLEYLLSDLTGKIQHHHIKVKFKIVGLTGNRCQSRYFGHEFTRDAVRSMIMRGTSCITGIFNFTTTDNFKYRVTTMIITRKRAKNSQQKTIRKIIYEVLNEYAKNTKHEMFIKGLLFGKYAENIRKIAKSIYPLRKCEIVKAKVIQFPAGVEDTEMGEDEGEDVQIQLKEHGKSIKAQKTKKQKDESNQSSDQDADEDIDEELVKEIEEEEKAESIK